MYFTYILLCENGSLYTGITTDVVRRFKEHSGHNAGGAKYTRSHKVVSIEAVWKSDSRSEASKLESFIKSLSRSKKLELIAEPERLKNIYSDKLCNCEYIYDDSFVGDNLVSE